ncbi:MAG: anti-sigma factor [Phycisphaerales bacterium]|jgi:hypothetical protein|nr:anti-sigma factor [Phycisphaerales bacterium]
MNRVTNAQLERLGDDVLDLMVRRACQGVGEQEAIELSEACTSVGVPIDAFDGAVDALLATGDVEAMPADVRERLARSASAFSGSAGDPSRNVARPSRPASSGVLGRLGWIAAAAGIALAAVAWFGMPRSSSTSDANGRDVVAMVDAQADAVHLAWGDWDDPEIAGVKGEVVWSDAAQSGYMRFAGLPDAGGDAQYQLWIIDAERGMEQRISGGVFDARAAASGEVLVPISPRLFVNRAAAFAVTIEKPSGTWVSDMSRRVVIASRG